MKKKLLLAAALVGATLAIPAAPANAACSFHSVTDALPGSYACAFDVAIAPDGDFSSVTGALALAVLVTTGVVNVVVLTCAGAAALTRTVASRVDCGDGTGSGPGASFDGAPQGLTRRCDAMIRTFCSRNSAAFGAAFRGSLIMRTC